MAFLEVRGVSKSFEGANVLSGVSFGLEQGGILCILGPSGCGKTTLLRIIAGLERPDSGAVLLNGRDITGMEPHRRRFGMMFQDFALFPHLNVYGNIAFGLKMQGRSRGDIMERTKEMLGLVGLEDYEKRIVSELSGGERQRVALARSLAPFPQLLLLDEPMGFLDRVLRERLLADLKSILKRIGMTTIFVSHDQGEAFAVADIVAVLDRGRIEQSGTPEDLCLHPASPRVARFLGLVNLMEGSVKDRGVLETPLGLLCLDTNGHAPGSAVTVLIRPDAARISAKGKLSPDEIGVNGIVKDRVFRGRTHCIELGIPSGETLVFELPPGAGMPGPGQAAVLALSTAFMTVMPVSPDSTPHS